MGDIGDYGKFGLLRFLSGAGDYNLGVNWYLTPDDGSSDGKYIDYLDEDSRKYPDKELHEALKRILSPENLLARNVLAIEKAKILNNAEFYNKELIFGLDSYDFRRRLDERTSWHEAGLEKLKECNLIFLDPDNGLEIKSSSPTSKKGTKFVTFREAIDYYEQGKDVVIYQHRCRMSEAKHIEKYLKFTEMTDIKSEQILVVTSTKVGLRDYVLLIHKNRLKKVSEAIAKEFIPLWKGYFTHSKSGAYDYP